MAFYKKKKRNNKKESEEWFSDKYETVYDPGTKTYIRVPKDILWVDPEVILKETGNYIY